MLRVAWFAVVLVAVACASGTNDTEPGDLAGGSVPEAPGNPSPPEEPPTTGIDDAETVTTGAESRRGLTEQVQQAAMDLAGRLGMGDADIEVFAVERVTWRDGSLGCPVEGRVYTQALVEDGYRIILTANGQAHFYHGAGSNDPFYCQDPQEPYSSGAGTG